MTEQIIEIDEDGRVHDARVEARYAQLLTALAALEAELRQRVDELRELNLPVPNSMADQFEQWAEKVAALLKEPRP